MNEFTGFGRMLIIAGVVLLVVGALLAGLGRFLPIGRLPGDILIRRGNATFYFPLATSLILSLLLSLLIRLLRR